MADDLRQFIKVTEAVSKEAQVEPPVQRPKAVRRRRRAPPVSPEIPAEVPLAVRKPRKARPETLRERLIRLLGPHGPGGRPLVR